MIDQTEQELQDIRLGEIAHYGKVITPSPWPFCDFHYRNVFIAVSYEEREIHLCLQCFDRVVLAFLTSRQKVID